MVRIIRADEVEFVLRRAVQLGLGIKWTMFVGAGNEYGIGPIPGRA